MDAELRNPRDTDGNAHENSQKRYIKGQGTSKFLKNGLATKVFPRLTESD